jgi:Spy/CpxP family protein refolding chaperone
MQCRIAFLSMFLFFFSNLFADDMSRTVTQKQKVQIDKNCQASEMTVFMDINLTTEQISKIKRFRQQLRERAGVEGRDNPLLRYTTGGAFDKAAFINSANQKSSLKNQATAEYYEQVYMILTPEQKNKIKIMNMEK